MSLSNIQALKTQKRALSSNSSYLMFIGKLIAVLVLSIGFAPSMLSHAQEGLAVSVYTAGKTNIYAVGKDYALKVTYLASKPIPAKVELAPKHTFGREVPEWSSLPLPKQGLSQSEYSQALGEIDRKWPLGSYLGTGNIGVVSNLQTWTTVLYENAVLEKSQSDNKAPDVYFTTIRYMQTVSAFIDEVRPVLSSNLPLNKVSVNGCSYWTRQTGLVKGQFATILAAGPTNEDCLSGQ